MTFAVRRLSKAWIQLGLGVMGMALGAQAGDPAAAAGWQWSRRTESLTGLFAQPGVSVFHLSFEKDAAQRIRFVWIATSQGLYRYDGYSATRFGKQDGLPSDFVRCVLATSTGKLWVGTDQGAGIFDGTTFSTAGSESGLAGPNVRRIIEDRYGTIWFTSDSWPKSQVPGGITSLRNGQWKAWHVRDGLPNDYVVDQFTDSRGRVFAMTSGGPARLNGQRWKAEPFGPLPVNTHWGSAAMAEVPGTGVVLSNGFATWVLRGERWERLGNPPRHNHGITTTRDGRILITGETRPAYMAFFEWSGTDWRQVSDEFRVPQTWGIFLTEAPDGSIWYAGIGCLERWARLSDQWRFLPHAASDLVRDRRGGIWTLLNEQRLSEYRSSRWTDHGTYGQVWLRDPNGVWAVREGGVYHWPVGGTVERFGKDQTGLSSALRVAVDRKGIVWAVGTATNADARLVSFYDGARWTSQPLPHRGNGHNVFQVPAQDDGMWYVFQSSSAEGWRLARVRTNRPVEIQTVPAEAMARFVNEIESGPNDDVYVFGEAGLHRWWKNQWQRLDSRSARRVVSVGFQGGQGWMVLHEALGQGDGIASLQPAGPFYRLENAVAFRADGDSLFAGGTGRLVGISAATGNQPYSITVPGGAQVLSASRDLQGTYWLSTSDGLMQFHPDHVPPETKIASDADKIVAGQPFSASMVAFSRFSLSRETASYSWRLDQGVWSPFTEERRVHLDPGILTVGAHQLEIRARDHGMDIDPTPATTTFEVLPLPIQDRPWFLPVLFTLLGAVGLSSYAAVDSRRRLLLRTAQEARLSLERYRHIVETAQEGIAVLDEDGNCTMANEEFSRIVGKPLPELIGGHFRNFVAKGRIEAFGELFEKQRLGIPVSYEASLEFPNGVQHVQASLRPIPSHDGSFQGALATLTDIAEQKLAQVAVRQSEENYRLLFETSPNARIVFDRATAAVLLANQAACDLYGFDRDEFTKKTLLDLQLPDQVESAKRLLAAPSPSDAFLRRHRKQDGTVFEAEIFAHDLEFEGRACRNVLVIDKTQEILAAKRLKESEQALANAQSIASIGSFEATIRNNQVTRIWSDELFRIVGLQPGVTEGGDWLSFVHPEDMAEAERIRSLMFTSEEPQTFEHRIVRTDGSVRRVRAISQIRPVPGGLQCIGTMQDVTDVRAMQEQLQQAQRLDSIGRLAGGIAHDFNNLLTVINGYSKLLLKKLDPDSELHEDIQQIADAGQEAAELTKRLLAFGRKQVLKPTALDLSEVVRQALPLLRRLAGDAVRIETSFTEDVIVTADLVQMNQVLVNLTANARDAMPSGGVLTFKATRLGDQVRLSVSDTGEGMSAGTAQRIFEPFFTTKERQGGTGLGLSSVYGIVHQSGGVIQCFSELGVGTRFEIWFPATSGKVSSASPIEMQAARGASGRSVLVVDDQIEVRKYAVEVLAGHGYEVAEASGGAEALELLRKRQWDLLLTDVVMPGMTGPELVARAEPAPRAVLYMSGYTRAEFDGQLRDAGTQILEKPFSPEGLLQAVGQAFREK